MSDINEKIKKEKEEIEQSRRRTELQTIREQKKQEKTIIRRQIIIGQMVQKYFPEVLNFQLHPTVKENKIEFMSLENFLYLLSTDKEYIEKLKKRITNTSKP